MCIMVKGPNIEIMILFNDNPKMLWMVIKPTPINFRGRGKNCEKSKKMEEIFCTVAFYTQECCLVIY